MFNRPLFVCAFALLAPSMTLAETETCQKVADKDIAVNCITPAAARTTAPERAASARASSRTRTTSSCASRLSRKRT